MKTIEDIRRKKRGGNVHVRTPASNDGHQLDPAFESTCRYHRFPVIKICLQLACTCVSRTNERKTKYPGSRLPPPLSFPGTMTTRIRSLFVYNKVEKRKFHKQRTYRYDIFLADYSTSINPHHRYMYIPPVRLHGFGVLGIYMYVLQVHHGCMWLIVHV